MNVSWKVYWLWCFSNSFIGLVMSDNQDVMEFKPVNVTLENSTQLTMVADMSTKKKTSLKDFKNSNILRDKNAYSSPNISKSDLSELTKNISVERNVFNQTNNNNLSVNVDVSTVGSNILPRNTRDLISELPSAPDVGVEISSVSTKNSSSSLNITEENRSKDEVSVPLSTNNTTYQLLKTTQEVSDVQTTPLSVVLKNPKDKESKTKSDTIQKQFKKPSYSVKKNSTGYNITIENSRPVNLTNYSLDTSNDRIVNSTINSFFNITDKTDKEFLNTNISTSSLQTIPESDGLQPFDIALITVAVIAIISTVTAIGMFSVMMYRRYHWNKPQTFSDKCSNADSTGYIDDSTLKENSEEMYSLDNDSFLNSLEAMTIQNYWADSFRHTKL